MTDNTQPLALMLADRLHHEQPTVLRIDAEHAGEELRRQHARIAELEAQLEAVGAGGVQALSVAPAEVVYSTPEEMFDAILTPQPSPTAQADSQPAPATQQAASSAVLKAIREANMQLVRTGDDAFMLVPYKVATVEQQAAPKAAPGEQFDSEGFRAWVRQNLPDDTIIGSSAWWADHLTTWAQRFVKAAPQQEAQKPVAWYEYNADLDAWFLAYRRNPKAKTRPLVFGDTTPQPAPAPLSEREAFESAWEKLHGKRPVLWSRLFAEHKMETPAHSEGNYFAAAEQAAWKLWQARAALAAQKGKA